MNKKGAEMTIGTIIVIILALVVLVVIIFGFSTGWNNLWQKITGLGGGKANIQTQVQACQLACSTDAKADYCKMRSITFKDNDKPVNLTCQMLASIHGSQYGLEPCLTITDCQLNERAKSCIGVFGSGWEGTWVSSSTKCSTTQIEVPTDLILYSERSLPEYSNQKCCASKVACPGADNKGWAAAGTNCKPEQLDITFMIDDTSKKDHLTQRCCVNFEKMDNP